MGAVRPARARRREAVGLRYRWRGNPRLHPRWHRGSSRNYQGSDRSRRLISRRVYRGAQRMLTKIQGDQPDILQPAFLEMLEERAPPLSSFAPLQMPRISRQPLSFTPIATSSETLRTSPAQLRLS